MEITKVEHHNEENLIDQLRLITMLKAANVKPYSKSCLSLERIHPNNIWPTQNYVLRSEFEKVRALRWAIREHGHDMFALNGYLTIWIRGHEEPINLLPPIIEETFETDGSLLPIINDGMHRMYLAWREWIVPQVVYIRGIPKEYPYYAYPMREGWQGIHLIEDNKDLGRLKKYHRIKDNKLLYRNFNSAFQNIGGPRGKQQN